MKRPQQGALIKGENGVQPPPSQALPEFFFNVYLAASGLIAAREIFAFGGHVGSLVVAWEFLVAAYGI